MAATVNRRTEDGLAFLTIDHSPLNALSAGVRKALLEAFDAAVSDTEVTAIVVIGAGAGFSGGIDLDEAEKGQDSPTVADLTRAFETSPKPVVAALHGTVVGAGLELALAAHGRVAHRECRIGLPDISLGMIPGAGGTQRAPRIAGAHAALEVLLSPRALSVRDAPARDFVDIISEGKMSDDAAELARRLAAQENAGYGPGYEQRRGFSDPAAYQNACNTRRAALGPREQAPAAHAIVDCVEAALLLPLQAGLALEDDLRQEQLASDASRGLRHIYRVERALVAEARRSAQSAGFVKPLRFGVIGESAALSGLCLAGLDSGHAAWALDAPSIQSVISATYDRAIGLGRMTQAQRSDRLARLSLIADAAQAPAPRDILLLTPDAAAQEMSLPPELAKTPRVTVSFGTKPDQTPAAMPVLAHLTVYPPSHHFRAVEVSFAPEAEEDARQKLLGALLRFGRLPVVRSATGPAIGAALLDSLRLAMDELVLAGASPFQVDRVLGEATAPFLTLDRDGLLAATPQQLTAQALIRAGRRGFYRYEDGRAQPDPETEDLIAQERARLGVSPSRIGDTEIVDHARAALAFAGAHLLQSGAVADAGRIDMIAVQGLGWLRSSGGPMKSADLAGLFNVQKTLRRMAWPQSEYLDGLVRNGAHFTTTR